MDEVKKTASYKKLMVIPFLVLAFSLVWLFNMVYTDSINYSIDFRGGTEISIETQSSPDATALKSSLSEYDANVRTGRGATSWTILVDVPSGTNSTAVIDAVREAGYSFDNFSVQSIGASLGKSFLQQAVIALVFAFIAMAIVIFIVFRIPLPSFYVILCGFADLIEAFVFSQILGINLSLASFAALLLLLGYSVDTDIVLTTRLMKSEGSASHNLRQAVKTGMTMTLTAISTLSILFILSVSPVVSEISAILVIGLLFDIMNTWITNAGLLRWYLEKRGTA